MRWHRAPDIVGAAGARRVLWAPTSVGSITKAFALNVSSTLSQATLVTLVDKSEAGQELALTPKQGTLMLDVSETPSIVLVAGKP